MTRISTFLLVFILSSGWVQAELRIGYVNSARVLKEAPQAETARKKLESEFAPRDTRIVDMQKQIKNHEDRLVQDTQTISENERKKREHEIISLKRDVKRAKEEFNEDLNFRRNEELSKLQKLVYDTILSVSRDEKYDIVLGESVLYASDGVDLTGKILERLKELSKQSVINK